MQSTQYSQVADRLRRAILDGTYAPGTRLPTERALCQEQDVSRITIRQALALLEDERLIIRRQGSGTYVRQNPARRIPLMIDYTGSVQEHAPNIGRELLTSRTIGAPEWVADELRLPAKTEVLYAERLDRLEQTAVAWDEVYIPLTFAGGLDADRLARVDFVEAWLTTGECQLTACRQQIEAVQAEETDRTRLGLASAAPLLKAMEIYYTANDRPAGLFVSHYHPQYINIISRHLLSGRE